MVRRSLQNRLGLFVLLSLLLHLLIAILSSVPLPKADVESQSPLMVNLLSEKKLKLADILPPEQEEKPDQADYAGLYDSRVKEEQVALTPDQRAEAQAPLHQASGLQQNKKNTKTQTNESAAVKLPEPEKRSVVEQLEQGRASSGSLPEDYFPNYKIGEHTYLNVNRYPSVGYFVRMKKVLKTTFNPSSSLRPYLFSNQISRGQIETVLGVALDPSGRLTELFIISSSGIPEYDEESMRTVRDSAPFSSPPEKLLAGDGQLHMSWTFTMYL